MLRASQISRICTHKPYFDEHKFMDLKRELDEKSLKKIGIGFSGTDIELDNLLKTPGFKTDVKACKVLLVNKQLVEEDPLPEGAKTYIEEVWLEQHYGFCDFSLKENKPSLIKGNLMEDYAIKLSSLHYGIPYTKNENRVTLGFLTGECDVVYQSTIRDNKCPETWATFRKKNGIEIPYKWQLIAYSILYGGVELYLDYVLTPNPPEVVEILTKNMSETEKRKFFKMEEAISKLTPKQCIKTFKYDGNLRKDQEFLLSRLTKAESYFKTLTYEKCMKL